MAQTIEFSQSRGISPQLLQNVGEFSVDHCVQCSWLAFRRSRFPHARLIHNK